MMFGTSIQGAKNRRKNKAHKNIEMNEREKYTQKEEKKANDEDIKCVLYNLYILEYTNLPH